MNVHPDSSCLRVIFFASIALVMSSSSFAQAPGNAFVLNDNVSSIEFSSLTLNPTDQPVIKGDVRLVYQSDGNLVMYKLIPNEPSRVLWDARVSKAECANTNVCQMRFIPGVGIVLYANGVEYWRSNLRAPQRAAKLWVSKVAPFLAIKSNDPGTPAGVNDPKTFGGNTLWTGMSRLNWFNVLDNLRNTSGNGMYGADRPGVTDFDTLFSNLGYWQNTAKNTHIFKFYSQPLLHYASLSAQDKIRLQNAIAFLRTNNIAMGVEMAMIERSPAEMNICGTETEGIIGVGAAQTMLANIKEAGGVVDFVAMDEPFYYGHYLASTGPVGPPPKVPCNYTTEALATAVVSTFKIVQSAFPAVVLGDIEPLYTLTPTAVQTYLDFLDKVETKIGGQVAFVHDDVSILNAAWKSGAMPLWEGLNTRRIPYGMIWNGNLLDSPQLSVVVKNHLPNVRWVAYAIGKTKQYEALGGPAGIHNVFQSWNTWPQKAGPETDQESLTFLANHFYTKSIRDPSLSSASVPVNRFHHAQLGHSYALGSYFASGFALEGQAFRVMPLGSAGTQALRLCKVVSTNRHFVSSANPPATVCEGSGIVPVSVLGGLSLSMDRNTSEPLYRCRHSTTGSYLATINPQECTFFPGAESWFVDGVMGYAVPAY